MDLLRIKPKNKMLYLLCGLVMALVFAISFNAAAGMEAENEDSVEKGPDRKVAVLIIDDLTLQDLQKPGLANLHRITRMGSLGLMNTRTGSLTETNRASAALTIGMGIRTQVDSPSALLSVKQQGDELKEAKDLQSPVLTALINTKNNSLINYVREKYPNNTSGLIGEAAHQMGKRVAIVGNADTDKQHRETFLMAMDRKGVVDAGYVGPDLLAKDNSLPWGFRTDSAKLLAYSLQALAASDIVFVEFGDTVRVHDAENTPGITKNELSKAREDAVKNADSFLGGLLKETDDNIVLILVSPTTSGNSLSGINKNLAPVVVYEKNKEPGILTSGTTKREGLVANIDLGPTIFDLLGLESSELKFLGDAFEYVPEPNNLSTVSDNLSGYINVKKARYVTHTLFVAILTVSLLSLYLPLIRGTRPNRRVGRFLAIMALALPAAAFLIPSVMGNTHYLIQMFLVTLVLLLIGVTLSGNEKGTLQTMAGLALLTSGFIMVNLLLETNLMQKTPLGFNDVFMGGRYYGINNDSMGLLLGSSVFGTFYIFGRLKMGAAVRLISGVIVFALVVLSQTPKYGANVGGTIAAMSTGVVGLMALISGQPIKKSKVLLTVAVVFTAELVIAYLDYLYGGFTHAGKVVGSLIEQGFGSKFLEVLRSKLSLFGIMLLLPPWNILLAAQIYIRYIVYKGHSETLGYVRRINPLLTAAFEVIYYGGLVAFVFNDTGVIATALMFVYLTLPVGVLINYQESV